MNIENPKLQTSIFRCSTDENSTLFLQESEGEKEASLSSRVVSLLLGDVTAQSFDNWVALVRKRSGKYQPSGFPHRLPKFETMPSGLFISTACDNQRMLPFDPSKKNYFQRRICDGDLVIVYERHDIMKAIKVKKGSELQNRFGVFKHSDWIGEPFGSKVLSSKGGFVYLLAPTPELWTLVLSHRTQILYIADISFVITYLEIVPGCLVLESGTGSGSLTTSLARAVAPSGHVHTFDFHEQRADLAREDFEKNGLSNLITVAVRDIQGEGFPEEFRGAADSVFLDLPQPWLAMASVARMLKQDGILCSFSPCIEQVQRSCETLRANFTDIRTFEILLRTYEVREERRKVDEGDKGSPIGSLPRKRQCPSDEASHEKMERTTSVMARPCSETKGHTGYLTFARLACI